MSFKEIASSLFNMSEQARLDRRKELHAELGKLRDTAGQGALSATERARVKDIDREIEEIDVLNAQTRLFQAEAERVNGIASQERTEWERRHGLGRPAGDRRTFRSLFPKAPLTNGGFNGGEVEFLNVLQSGRYDPRLQSAMFDDGGSAGGFAVPTEFAAKWLDTIVENSLVLSNASLWPMQSKTLAIPAFRADGGNDGPYGVPAEWIPEDGESTMTGRTFQLRNLTLTARSLALYVEVSNALAEDGSNFTDMLRRAMAESSGWHLDRAFLTGSGAGQPRGLLTADARVVVAKEAGQAADTIKYDNVVKMVARLTPASFKRSVWVASQTALTELLKLTIEVGTGGAPVPVLKESNGQLTLLTRPVLVSEKLPALGEEGDLALVDFSAYQVGLRANVGIDVSGHVGFRRNATAFRLIIRVDGAPGLQTAYTPANGDTLSPFVLLAERA